MDETRIDELRDAIAFLDKVRASRQSEQIAVGTDHWDRLEKAARAAALQRSTAPGMGEVVEDFREAWSSLNAWQVTAISMAR